MSEQAFHLVDRVLPRAPYRQWVLTLPWDLARAVAFDAELCRRVFGLLAEEIARWQRSRARAAGIDDPEAGSILEIQRFADGARCWPHAHLLAADGVFYETADGCVRFRGIGPPRDRDVEAILTRVCERVGRLLKRRARAGAEGDEAQGAERQLLLQCAAVSPSDRVAIEGWSEPGERRAKDRRARRRKRLCVRSPEGLELHADVHVEAADRAGLERLCKYLARPAIPDGRLTRLPDGRIEFALKRVWKGGVRSLVFAPEAFIARMAALIPLPKTHMRRFFGVFAAAHSLRSRIVPRPPSPKSTAKPVAPKRPARMSWADLLTRTWNIDALRCSYCQGRLRVISAVHDPTALQAIIAAVQLADARAAEQRRDAQDRGPPSRLWSAS